jgi:GH15 family glucan-1,4-alpha-glucosidase
MRVVGRRSLPGVGLRGPTDAEIQASVEHAEHAPRIYPKGVYRYRNHAEANAQMEKWLVDGLVKRNRDLDRDL